MGIFRQFPYSNFHEMNLDWIINTVKQLEVEWDRTRNEWGSYKEFIDNYFNNLDLSAETLQALRRMASSGELSAIIDPTIVNEVNTWLALHITQPTDPVIDNSLSISGAGADSAVTGNYIRNLLKGYNFGDHNFLTINNAVDNKTQNGVQFTKNIDGSISVIGTATGTAFFDFFNNSSKLPDWIIKGEKYKITYYPESPNLRFRIFGYRDGSILQPSLIDTTRNAEITIPDDINGLIIRLSVDAGYTINETIMPVMTLNNLYTNEQITNYINKIVFDSNRNLIELFKVRNRTSAGVQYSVVDDGIHVEGTATATSFLDFYNDGTKLPPWITPGGTYILNYLPSNEIRFRIYAYRDGSPRLLLDTMNNAIFTIPKDILDGGIIIRLVVESGTTVNETVHPILTPTWAYKPNDKIIYPEYNIIHIPEDVANWQDFEVVNNEIWFTSSSDDDHLTMNGIIYRIKADDFSYIGFWKHNLGHLNGIDYDPETDSIIVGNASSNERINPEFYIFKNVSNWVELEEINFLTIEKTVFDLQPLITDYGFLPYVNACWGEKKFTGERYVYVNAYVGGKWFKISPTIINGSYTGEYTVIAYKDCNKLKNEEITTAQVIQGMKMYKGKIIASISHDPITGCIYTFTNENIEREIIKIDGTGLNRTNEGLTIKDGVIMLGHSGSHQIAAINL